MWGNEEKTKERIVNYWEKRSESFLDQRRKELHSPLAERWMKEILPWIPKKKEIKILDVGCGAGFFSILLAHMGYEVTGVDLVGGMIESAKILASEEVVFCSFYQMDAEHLAFEDASYDVVIARNLTWTLPDAMQGYREWIRVLKNGGILMNIDANYGNSNFEQTKELPKDHAHSKLGNDMMHECEAIKQELRISTHDRPKWDIQTLQEFGMKECQADVTISERIYLEKDEFYNPTPLFLITAKK